MSGAGYAIAFGPCWICGGLFGFNPHLVPSKEGEPICEPCMGHVNARRVELGLEPFVIPEGAYEPVDASEVL